MWSYKVIAYFSRETVIFSLLSCPKEKSKFMRPPSCLCLCAPL